MAPRTCRLFRRRLQGLSDFLWRPISAPIFRNLLAPIRRSSSALFDAAFDKDSHHHRLDEVRRHPPSSVPTLFGSWGSSIPHLGRRVIIRWVPFGGCWGCWIIWEKAPFLGSTAWCYSAEKWTLSQYELGPAKDQKQKTYQLIYWNKWSFNPPCLCLSINKITHVEEYRRTVYVSRASTYMPILFSGGQSQLIKELTRFRTSQAPARTIRKRRFHFTSKKKYSNQWYGNRWRFYQVRDMMIDSLEDWLRKE